MRLGTHVFEGACECVRACDKRHHVGVEESCVRENEDMRRCVFVCQRKKNRDLGIKQSAAVRIRDCNVEGKYSISKVIKK